MQFIPQLDPVDLLAPSADALLLGPPRLLLAKKATGFEAGH
jgi:hypothetical protein